MINYTIFKLQSDKKTGKKLQINDEQYNSYNKKTNKVRIV